MRPQFFPWLFDDKEAWEKSLASPGYSYDLPIDNFMAIYQVDRKSPDPNASDMILPTFSPVMHLPNIQPTMPATPFAAMPLAAAPAAPAPAPVKEESKIEEGILSQDEIDALLSGL